MAKNSTSASESRPDNNNVPEQKVQDLSLLVDTRGQSINFARLNRMTNQMQHKELDDILRLENATCRNNQNDDPFLGTSSLFSPDKNDLALQSLPYGVLLGAQKAGTTALHSYLSQHPDVLSLTKEVYVLDMVADKLMLVDPKGGIPQAEVRRHYEIKYAPTLNKMQTQARKPKEQILKDKIILDMSPNYLYESDRVPARLTCVLPWAKVFLLLRDPIDRAYSQYIMKLNFLRNKKTNEYGRPLQTFDQYIQADLAALKEAGVIRDWSETNFDEFFGSDEEYHAWRLYSNSGLNSPIGFGLYALQIAHFLKEFDRVGKPRSDLLVLKNVDLDRHPSDTYHRVLDFLGLRRIDLRSFPHKNAGRRRKIINEQTRKLLQDTFEPYNRKMAELLGSEWEGVWT